MAVGGSLTRRRATAAGFVLAAVASFLPAIVTSAEGAAAADPVRILVVGDSMTMGSAGDWTWRYRLWQHLTGAGVAVDLVGPRTDMYDDVTGQLGSHAYVDPGFDQDHASRWGMAFAFPDVPIGELVATYHPDVIVEMLGVNDLAILGQTPAQVEGMLRSFIADARGVDPGVDLVVARLPQPWRAGVPEYNARVDAVATELDTPSSRVVAAQTDAGYMQEQDTWEGSHPNSHGELKIAAAVADSLSRVGTGPPAARPLPDVPRGPRIRPVLAASAAVRGASLSWVRSPGAQTSQVWLRDATRGAPWRRVAGGVTGTSLNLSDLAGWHRFELKVLPVKWDWAGADDAFSNVVEVRALDDRLDRPRPSVSASAFGVAALRWDDVPGATRYVVQWRPREASAGWQTAPSVVDSDAVVAGLRNRRGYSFRVRAKRGALASAFSGQAAVVVPALPAARRVRARVTRSGAVVTSAADVAAATSYTLRVAGAPSCRDAPATVRFRVAARRLPSPQARVRIQAPAVWVRWVGVRRGVEGLVAGSSTACVHVPG